MAKHRTPHAAEFRAQMAELVKAGRTPKDLEKEFEPTAQTIGFVRMGGYCKDAAGCVKSATSWRQPESFHIEPD